MLADFITTLVIPVVVMIITWTMTPFPELGIMKGEKEIDTFKFGHLESEVPRVTPWNPSAGFRMYGPAAAAEQCGLETCEIESV